MDWVTNNNNYLIAIIKLQLKKYYNLAIMDDNETAQDQKWWGCRISREAIRSANEEPASIRTSQREKKRESKWR